MWSHRLTFYTLLVTTALIFATRSHANATPLAGHLLAHSADTVLVHEDCASTYSCDPYRYQADDPYRSREPSYDRAPSSYRYDDYDRRPRGAYRAPYPYGEPRPCSVDAPCLTKGEIETRRAAAEAENEQDDGECGPACWYERFQKGYCGHGCEYYREGVSVDTDYQLVKRPRVRYYRKSLEDDRYAYAPQAVGPYQQPCRPTYSADRGSQSGCEVVRAPAYRAPEPVYRPRAYSAPCSNSFYARDCDTRAAPAFAPPRQAEVTGRRYAEPIPAPRPIVKRIEAPKREGPKAEPPQERYTPQGRFDGPAYPPR